MGVSTNAYLYYGIDIFDQEGDIALPDKIFEGLDEEEQDDFDLDEYLEEALIPFGLEYGTHGCEDCLVHYIAAKKYIAYRGYPEEVDDLGVKPEWDKQLEAFCEATGFEFKKPGWRLASYWGQTVK